jgi:hypothetical protein
MGLTPRSVKDQEEARSKFHSSAKTGSRAESSGGADLPRKLDAFFDESRWGRHRKCTADGDELAQIGGAIKAIYAVVRRRQHQGSHQ